MSLIGSVEAALFALGAPANADEIGRLVGSPAEDVTGALEVLRKDYKERDGGLVISKTRGGVYALEVRPHYLHFVTRLVPTEIDTPTLKTLALVAVMQPVPQSEIVRRRGDKAYNHIRSLAKRGLVKRERAGRSYDLTTTQLFGKTFRFKDDPDSIREALLAQLDKNPASLQEDTDDVQLAPAAVDGALETSVAGSVPADEVAPLPVANAELEAATPGESEAAPGAPQASAEEAPAATPESTPSAGLPRPLPFRRAPDPGGMKLETGDAFDDGSEGTIPLRKRMAG